MKTERRIEILCWAGLIVFTLYLLVVNRSYYFADTQVPTYDEAWYLETSLNLYHRLTTSGLGDFVQAYRHAFGTKAPLIAVLALPFYLVFGTSQYSAMLVNSLFIVITNLYLFLLVRRLFSSSAGLAAVVFYQTMPLAYGLSRSFMTEYGLAALVIVWIYYLVASEGLTDNSACLALGVVLGLGLLMKVLFPAFVAGPFVWALARRKAGWRSLAAIGIPGLLIAGTWYAFNLVPLLNFAWQSAYGSVGGEYTAGGFRPWILLIVNQGVSCYYAAAIAVLGSAALLLHGPGAVRDDRTILLLSWLGPPFLAAALGRNQLIRFALPLLPVFAIVLSVAVFQLGRRWILQAGLAVLVAVFPQRLYAALSYPVHGEHASHAVGWGPFILFARDLGWARPPVWENPWERRRLLEAIRRLAPDADQPYYVMLAVDHVYLNANLLNYLNAYLQYPMQFTSLGYGESAADKALERIYRFDARFVILAENFQQLPPFLNRLNSEVAALISRGDLPFRRRAEVALAHSMKALIYERDEPWTSFPPGIQVRPEHRNIADFTGGVRFVGYDWKRRDRLLWEMSCYWTTFRPVGEDYRIDLEVRRSDEVILRRRSFLTGGRHPLPEWHPGEIIKQTTIVYLDPQRAGAVEARISLISWGVGPEDENVVRVRLMDKAGAMSR